METNDNDQLNKVNYQLKKEYKSIKKIIKEDEFILIYADDEILWKIFEDKIDDYRSIEFDAETNESHFIKILP